MVVAHSPSPIALVTGANRGIGMEVARQLAELNYTVVLGVRNLAAGQKIADQLVQTNRNVLALQLDVTNPRSVQRAAYTLDKRLGRLDALINNAAVHYDTWQSAAGADLTVVEEALQTNLLGPWRMAQAMLPLVRRSSHPRIVNVSSGAGSITSMGAGPPAYQVSKAALNALTRTLAAELRSGRILVNAVCPGWVATDMGGPGGRPLADGAAGVVWAVSLDDTGPTGGFFRDGEPIPW